MEKKIKEVMEKYYDIGNIENIDRIKKIWRSAECFYCKNK